MPERLKWVMRDRESFLGHLKELKEHNDYFSSVIQLRPSHQQQDDPLVADRLTSTTKKLRNTGYHLRRLIQGLSSVRDSQAMVFEIMLYDDPFEFHTKLRKDEPALTSLRTSSSAFAMQLLQVPMESSAATIPQLTLNYPVFLEVPPETQLPSRDPPSEALPSIETVGDLQNQLQYVKMAPVTEGYCRPTGSLSANDTDRQSSIRIFYDTTPYTRSKTLLEALNNPAEHALRKLKFLGFRARLANVIATSFVHHVIAGYPLEYESKQLHYYSTTPDRTTQTQATDLAAARINPYIQLRAIGA
ncbi:hypothetical protein BFJ68_g18053 [Fusarium oxysporum]|uniref:Uncharacterized protein n=1 Tax=Fusarium oxysporum TaxID=5507 RepID=A0A420N757_FUSOX|nr:hypothetical protein BFJ68_g18053 [Fusarium oxysporum]